MLHTGAEPRIKQRKLGRHGLKLLKLIHVIAMEVDAAWLDLSSGIEGISSWLAVRPRGNVSRCGFSLLKGLELLETWD